MIRKIVFWLHLSVASAAGAVVFMLAATGAVLSLEETVTGLAERRYRVEVQDGSPRLAAGGDRRSVGARGDFAALSFGPAFGGYSSMKGGTVTPVSIPAQARCWPSDLALSSASSKTSAAWHRWFNLSGGSVRKGRAVTGAVNVAFLFLLLTGARFCGSRGPSPEGPSLVCSSRGQGREAPGATSTGTRRWGSGRSCPSR